MTKGDFEFDRDYFAEFLERRDVAAEIAKRNLWELFGCWTGLSEAKLGGRVQISLGEVGERVTGSVLGKAFAIDVSARACETCTMLEAVLSVPSLNKGHQSEIGRFLISPSGEILSCENETILACSEDTYIYDEDALGATGLRSYDVLIAVLRKVMQAPLTI